MIYAGLVVLVAIGVVIIAGQCYAQEANAGTPKRGSSVNGQTDGTEGWRNYEGLP